MREMMAFFLHGERPLQMILDARMEEAKKCLNELRREAENVGIRM